MSDAHSRIATFEAFDRKPSLPDVLTEVAAGLGEAPKSIPPKYFYDRAGSELFEAITRLPEYYLTRTEIGILTENRTLIADCIGRDTCLVEYGSGDSRKVRILLEACSPQAYVPVDISRDYLIDSAKLVFDGFPALSVYPVCADYTAQFELPSAVAGLRRVAFFPGSSIGNFEPEAVVRFLSTVASTVGSGGMLIIGVDAKKDERLLVPAYNDAAGVTAQFNKNLLRHLNATVGTDFDPDGFEHRAVYNAAAGRIEMYLDARRDQTVHVNGDAVAFRKGEPLHTENSYKYMPDEFIETADQCGFDCVETLQDADRHFMVLLLEARGADEPTRRPRTE